MKKNILYIIFLLLISLIVIAYFYSKFYFEELKIESIEVLDDELVFYLNKDAKCSINNNKVFINSNNKKCVFNSNEIQGTITLKNAFGKEFEYSYGNLETPVKGYVESINIKNKKIYLAPRSSEKIIYDIKAVGEIEKDISFISSNEEVFKVDEEGIVSAISNGKAILTIRVNELEEDVSVVVTDLIVEAPLEFDYYKSYIPCGVYSAEDNDLMDEILEYRVSSSGYATRAGVVAAARFFLLEFPYKLTYFSENGRLSTNGIDGEGRYYHKGMFLNNSRFSKLNASLYGPQVWGCPIYSVPAEHNQNNGLDCSGFVSWVLVQGGFDPGDVGAGVSYGHDLTDLGELHYLPDSFDDLKVGDLLSGEAIDGGHIAIVVGKKDEHVFIGESLWYGGIYLGPVLRKYDREELLSNFYWLVMMDDYYKVDGELTDYWK